MSIFRVIFLSTLLFASFLIAGAEKNYAWYASFYQTLAQKKINSIRYFQVWVAPGKNSPDTALPIGGSEENFQLWRETLEEFIESSQMHLNIWDGDFFYEIMVDDYVYQKHQELFQFFKKKYGEQFNVSFVTDYQPEEASPLFTGYHQCVCGVPAVCSDYIRITQTPSKNFDVNIYVDIDTLSQALKNKKQASYQELGVNINENGIYFPFFSKKLLSINIDMLVFKGVSELTLRYMTALLEERLNIQKIFFNNVLAQSFLLDIKNIDEYQESLRERVLLFLSEPRIVLNRDHVITDTVSANFWLRLSQKGLAYPYWESMADTVENYYSWKVADFSASYESVDVGLIEKLYSEQEQKMIIQLILMLYDKEYLRQKSVNWYQDFRFFFEEQALSNKKFIISLPSYFNFLKKNLHFYPIECDSE